MPCSVFLSSAMLSSVMIHFSTPYHASLCSALPCFNCFSSSSPLHDGTPGCLRLGPCSVLKTATRTDICASSPGWTSRWPSLSTTTKPWGWETLLSYTVLCSATLCYAILSYAMLTHSLTYPLTHTLTHSPIPLLSFYSLYRSWANCSYSSSTAFLTGQ